MPYYEEAYLLNGDTELQRLNWDSYDKAKKTNHGAWKENSMKNYARR